MKKIVAQAIHNNIRLDKFLCREFNISFDFSQKVIREKKVKVNNNKIEPSYKIKAGDEINIFTSLEKRNEKEKIKPPISQEKIKKFFSFKIFEDNNILVIDKPSGLAVQGRSLKEPSIDDFIYQINKQNPKYKLFLVHRIDRDTSGILILAKTREAAAFLSECFKNKTIKKTYLALVCGDIKKVNGQINIPLIKKVVNKIEKVYPDLTLGKEAISNYKVVKKYDNYCLVELNPITGRTHQLRVHCKEIGHPIVNDFKYGGKKSKIIPDIERLCLHAYSIAIDNYYGKKLEIKTLNPVFF